MTSQEEMADDFAAEAAAAEADVLTKSLVVTERSLAYFVSQWLLTRPRPVSEDSLRRAEELVYKLSSVAAEVERMGESLRA
jgi:hypothetical protein